MHGEHGRKVSQRAGCRLHTCTQTYSLHTHREAQFPHMEAQTVQWLPGGCTVAEAERGNNDGERVSGSSTALLCSDTTQHAFTLATSFDVLSKPAVALLLRFSTTQAYQVGR